MINPEWTQEERGWYTHPCLGGICQERNGWYWFPLKGDRQGPFKTLRQTVVEAEKKPDRIA